MITANALKDYPVQTAIAATARHNTQRTANNKQMALPRIINSPAPEPPRKMSYSFSASISKKDARKLRLLVNPLTRPAHISPKKKVSWRLTKKWFNRYEKPIWLQRTITAVSKDGSQEVNARITDVRITKAGGHKREYTFTCTPITK